MDRKLNFAEFSEYFAKAAGVSLAQAESFVRTFFDTVVEGLEKDGSVKINGLGTFKIIEVESRSSVNINTGERFEISGHKRLTFIPADSLKDVINAPFAMFEPVEVDDDIDDEDDSKEFSNEDTQDDENINPHPVGNLEDSSTENSTVEQFSVPQQGEIAAETVSIPITEIEEEIPQDVTDVPNLAVVTINIEEEMPIDESDYTPENIPVNTVDEFAEVRDENVESEMSAEVHEFVSDGLSEVKGNEVAGDDILPVAQEDSDTPSAAAEKNISSDAAPASPKENNNKNSSKLFFILTLIVLFVVATFMGVRYFDGKIFTDNSVNEKNLVVKEVKVEKIETIKDSVPYVEQEITVESDSVLTNEADTIVPEVQTVVARVDTVIEPIRQKEEKLVEKTSDGFELVDALAARELSTIFVADTTDYKIVGTTCVHKVKSEETLIRISQKYYGDKRLWPYIVKYNNMLRPNDLACDMMLKIPRLIPK